MQVVAAKAMVVVAVVNVVAVKVKAVGVVHTVARVR